MELVYACLHYRTGSALFGQTAFIAMIGGAGLGWDGLLWFWDSIILYRSLPRSPAGIRCALMHGALDMVVLYGYNMTAFTKWKHYPE